MKIVVIEDHQLVRDMLISTCASVISGAEARGAATGSGGVLLCKEFQPDLVLLDLELPDGDGLDFLPEIFQVSRSTKVIALTSHADEVAIHRALKAHVHGFVDKNEQPVTVLKEAVYTVMRGAPYYSSLAQRLRMAMRSDSASFDKRLSDYEQKLVGLFGDGLTNEEIARKLGLSANTIRNTRSRIMNKLDLHGTPELMRYAMEKGFSRVRRPAASYGSSA